MVMTESMMPQSHGATRYVFVYGTLRSGGSNDIARYRPAPRRVADAQIPGTLYDLGRYPGAVLGGPGRLIGEIYEVSPSVEAQLDVLEDVAPGGSGEYLKCEVNIAIGDADLACLVYEINPARIAGRLVIASGDWMALR